MAALNPEDCEPSTLPGVLGEVGEGEALETPVPGGRGRGYGEGPRDRGGATGKGRGPRVRGGAAGKVRSHE